jgi:RNA polymerase sigma-70 factor (ECF subfamily)
LPESRRQRFVRAEVGHVRYFASPETDPAARRESYVRPVPEDDAVTGPAPSADLPLMVRSCVRGQPPFDGLAALRCEVVRFRAAPGRRAESAGTVEGSAHHSAQHTAQHTVPSASPPPGTAAPGKSGQIRPNSVPGPAAPPSGPLSIVGSPDRSAEAAGSDGGTPDVPDAAVADLVSRAQAGDADAFGALYDRYLDLVYRYIYYRVGGVALAEDLASETFLRALRRIDSFSWQGRDFAAWLVTIARNLIADHYKSGRYRLEITTEDILDAAPAQTADGPENQVLDALTNRTLLEAVQRLGAEQQECIVLRFLQGLSVTETALVMGKNDGAIKALQYRAVRALARLLPADKLR